MIKVILYTREGCHLCDEAKEHLRLLRPEIPHQLVEIDIESDAALHEHYMEKIPVVQIGPYTLQAPFTETNLRVTLSAARDGFEKRSEPKGRSETWTRRINRLVLGFSRHWLAFVNLIVFTYVGLSFAAPVLMKAGYEQPASVLYAFYGKLCHQLAFRSWFIYGEQPVYPRELAGTSWGSYGDATGLSEGDIVTAAQFVGNEELGYKVALCERDIAIYATILLFGLTFGFFRKRMKPLPIWVWLAVGIVPIALDGGSQLVFGTPLPLLSLLPMRESTPFLRTLTGFLFGITNAWLSFPYLEESMVETRIATSAQVAAAEEHAPS